MLAAGADFVAGVAAGAALAPAASKAATNSTVKVTITIQVNFVFTTSILLQRFRSPIRACGYCTFWCTSHFVALRLCGLRPLFPLSWCEALARATLGRWPEAISFARVLVNSVYSSSLTHEARLAESSDAAEPMVAYEDRKVPAEGRGGLSAFPEGA